MIRRPRPTTLIASLLLLSCLAAQAAPPADAPRVKLGIDVFLENPPAVVKGKRLGLVTNHTGVDSKGRSDVDTIGALPGGKLTALFGPEHGIRGDAPAGAKIADNVDARSGLPVFSLYGELRKPTPLMLKDVDVLVFDI